MRRFALLCVVCLLLSSPGFAQSSAGTAPGAVASAPNGPMSDLQVDTVYQRAFALTRESKWTEALPLSQQVTEQRPGSAKYAELLARTQVGVAGGLDGPAQTKMYHEAYESFLRARSLGDNSNLLQIMLEQLGARERANAAGASAKTEPATPYDLALNEAEKTFNRGDYAGSIPLYEKAAALNPKSYTAPLFAGDAAYKAGRYDDAYAFYARAIAINPNQETAYRYWGDTLMKAGKRDDAEGKFIDAVVAWPYARASRVGLQQWAQQTNHVFQGPEIHLPEPTITPGANGGLKVSVVAGKEGDPNAAAWMNYQIRRTAPFLPNRRQADGKPGRRTLAEEDDALRSTLIAAKTVPEDKLDPSLKTLRELGQKGMLESWILLFDADEDIAQDYPAYRDAHRPLLAAFLREYCIRQK